MIRKFEIFIANKFIRGRNSYRSTSPIIRISIAAIALSTAVMLLTAAVVKGFKKEISQKVIGFGAHIEISHYSDRNSYESEPMRRDRNIETREGMGNVAHIQAYATKPVILKKGEIIQANVLKGVDSTFNTDFFTRNLKKGKIELPLNSDIVISRRTASVLGADLGDDLLLYFIQDPPRMRKLRVSAIYESGFSQFDDLISLTDIHLIQRINGWDHNQLSGYEVLVKDLDKIGQTRMDLHEAIPYELNAQTIFEKYPDIFNWLELQDVNYLIIITLMLLVAVINSISALVILILEKTRVIGILKTIGLNNTGVARIFIYQGGYLLLSGLFWGNLIGIGLAVIQENFHLIKLPVESYYLPSVPIQLAWTDILFINSGAFLICLLALLMPSHLISRIVIARVIKFD